MIQYCWEEVNYLQSMTGCSPNNGEGTITYLHRLVAHADEVLLDADFYNMPIKVKHYLNTSILSILRSV